MGRPGKSSQLATPRLESPAVIQPADEPFVRPYPPSWFDRVMAWVDRVPGSYVIWYSVFAVMIFALVTVSRLAAGVPAFGGDLGNRAFFSFMTVFPLFLLQYLNHTAGAAFSAFTPALQSPEEAPLLRYRLTTAPAVPSILFSLGAAGVSVVQIAASPELESYSEAIYGPGLAAYFFGALSWFISSHFAYRVIHQLVRVSRTYESHARVSLGDQGPTFALSRLTSRAAIASILVVSGYMVAYAQLGSLTLTLIVLIPNLFLAGSAFVLPLAGAHRLLDAERYRWRRETTQRMEVAREKLHQLVERGEYAAVPAVKDAITALDIELTRLARIPTWPWNPGTPRGVVAAVFLPVMLWLIQYGLGRLLG